MDGTESPRGRDENQAHGHEAHDDETHDRAGGGAPVDRTVATPDVLLDVPELKVDEISLDVDDLRARVSLRAEVLDLLGLGVGADVSLGGVHLDIKGVDARAVLKVRLDNVAAIVDRVLTTIDRNPRIVEEAASGLRSTAESLGGGVGRAAGELGSGAGAAVEEVGEHAGEAVREAGEAVGDAGEAAGRTVGETAGETVGETAGETAGTAREATGHTVREAPGGAPAEPRRDRGERRERGERGERTERGERAERTERGDTGAASSHRPTRGQGRRRGGRPP
ncbi:hypothetical protein [Streptomyces macrosporus]|uniref:Uncharacterized protein n=1 Tax=Streptomyces macrosporus TaxID=44032 RepID=A0ABN3KCG9_9ACTN